jgi:hypothetical protein
MNLAKNPFLKEWVSYNFLGWLLGIVIGPLLFYFVIRYEMPGIYGDDLYDRLSPVFVSFPLGAGLGVMQQVKLRQWNISPALWIAATSLGFGIPISLITWVFQSSALRYDIPISWIIVEVILIGICLGGSQALLLRKLISKPSYWILTYVFGILSLGVVLVGVVGGALLAAEPMEELLYSLGLYIVIKYRDELLLLFTGMTFPFFAAFLIGFPTGMILQKFGNMKITENKEDLAT